MDAYEELFKGFILTKNKQAIEKFKGRTDLKTFDQVENEPEFAGVLNENILLIDIDDFETSEVLFNIVQRERLNCLVIKTGRGKHFYFKNSGLNSNKTNTSYALGFKGDNKLGIKNSYAVLKTDGNLRDILYSTKEIGFFPVWLTPISKDINFREIEIGERNQKLFNYILTLQDAGLTEEEIRETIRLINKYILMEPLPEKEIETILRSDSFKKQSFFKGTTFLFDRFANYIKNNHHIIKVNNQLHIYNDGVYYSNVEDIESTMVKHISNLNRAKRTEVLSYLRLICQNWKASDADLIGFKNGVYNLEDDSFIEYSPTMVITNKINWNYNPATYSELVDNTLNKIACQDGQIRMLLEEILGAVMYRSNTLAGGKAFILLGDKSNGKSTFLDMVSTMLGEENIASLELRELGDKFKTAELFGKLANIGDDIGDEFISNAAIFKKLVTGERLNVERKGQDPFEFNNYSKMLFSANNMPRMGKGRDTGAILRRLVIIPFNARFNPDDPDFTPGIKYDLRKAECIEYMINLGLVGLKRVLKNKTYTKSSKVEQELNDYEVANNPLLSFIKECEDEDYQIENQATKKVYEHYCVYCMKNNFQPVNRITFSKQINVILGFKTDQKKIQGVKYQVFVRDGTT